MSSQLIAAGGVALVAIFAIGSAYLLGMRAKSPLVLGAVIALTRTVINPRQMRTAGTPGAYASVIEHRGRRSGRAYRTPVGAVATEDGFIITLPYGLRSQWVRNVLASGSATLVTEGRTWAVDRPELMPAAAAEPYLSASDVRANRLFRVEHCLRLRRVALAESAGSVAPASALRVA